MRCFTAALAAVGHANCLVIVAAVSIIYSVTLVAARFDPNRMADHAVDAYATQALHRHVSHTIFHVASTWLFGAPAAPLPWQLELAPLWQTLR